MLKFIRRSLLALVAMLSVASVAVAQQLTSIPVDSAVRIGKLPNGLTYYIRHNETPKGQADFYIAQKVGSILEEESQRGLAHFLEHMCFNGTTNFPGNSLINWLESKGVKFGVDLNAYTDYDVTVYNISNVPVASTAVQDSCLLILHDWANDLLLDPEEIDKERGVIHEEWRMRMVGQMNIIEKVLPTVYPNNKYGERLPIGLMEVVDNFPYQDLRDYYEAWYRPDQQGIIVVGDINVDYIESKIKEMFSSIEMPENAKERVYTPVEDNEGTIYAIGSDPEMPQPVAMLMFKTDQFPNELKNNPMYMVQQYAEYMMATMLNHRLDDLANSPDATFVSAGVHTGDFFVSDTKDALTVQIVPKDDFAPAVEAVYRELLRAQRGGFTEGEYERARAEYLSQLEKEYNSRNSRQTAAYVNEYVNNFIKNEPIPSVEDEYMFMSQMTPMINVASINEILPELIDEDGNNRVFMFMAPQNDTFKIPTEAEIAAVIASVDAEDIEPYQDAMKAEPLIPELPTPGKVTSITDDAQWGAKVVTLSNGVKVYVKPTDFKKDDIRFEAIALGGNSSLSDNDLNTLMGATLAFIQHGLGDYTSSDLRKYLQGKQAGVAFTIDDYTRNLSGTTTVKDLPTLMEMIYMTFIDFNINESDFKTSQAQLASQFATLMAHPEVLFEKTVADALYTSPLNHFPTTEVIMAADREAGVNYIRKNLANAADFTFFFVGDIDMDTLIPLLEQYIATLPADAANATKSYASNSGLEVRPGKATDTATAKMETPQVFADVVISGNMPYTPKNRILTAITSQVLSTRLLNKIREEMGATYSIGAMGELSRTGNTNTTFQIKFPMKPEVKDEALTEVNNIVNAMVENVTDDELNPIKEFMLKTYAEQKELNAGWIGAMSATQINGVDFFNGVEDTINSITPADIQNYMKQLLDLGNYRVVILDPEQ